MTADASSRPNVAKAFSTRRRFSHASSLGGYDSSVGDKHVNHVKEDGEEFKFVASDDMHPSAYLIMDEIHGLYQ